MAGKCLSYSMYSNRKIFPRLKFEATRPQRLKMEAASFLHDHWVLWPQVLRNYR
jgi:hypothetical protein